MNTGIQAHGKFRRPIWGLAVAVLLLAGGFLAWQGVKHYLHIDRYAPLAASAITEFTGLPASIGALDLSLLPTPNLVARNITIGEGDFRLEAPTLAIHARLRGLLRRDLDIVSIKAQPVTIFLPATTSDLTKRVAALLDKTKGTPTEKDQAPAAAQAPSSDGKIRVAGFTLTVRRILLNDLSIHRGDSVFVEARAEIHDLLSPKIAVEAHAGFPALSKAMTASAEFSLLLPPGAPPKFEGAASVQHADIEELAGDDRIPHTRFNLDAKVSGVLPDEVSGDLSGALETDVSKSFSGKLRGHLAWKEGRLTLSDAGIDSPSLTLTAETSVEPGGNLSMKVAKAEASGDGLRTLLSMIPIGGYRLEPKTKAAFTLADLEIGPVPGSALGLVSGALDVQGIDLVRASQGNVLANISGKVRVENNAFAIQELGSEGVQVEGLIRPDFAAHTVRVELSGEADLAAAQMTALIPGSVLSGTGGKLLLKRASATIEPGKGMPPDLRLDGAIQNGRFALETPGYKDSFSKIEVSFGLKDDIIQGKIALRSERLGELQFDGEYAPLTATLKGALALDAAQVTQSFLPEGAAQTYAMPLARAFGASTFDVTLQAPTEKDATIHIQAKRQGAPSVQGAIELAPGAGNATLRCLTVTGDAPLGLIAAALPWPVQADGAAKMSLRMGAAEPGFHTEADLTDADLRLGAYLEKKPGAPSMIVVTGIAEQLAGIQSVQFSVLGQNATLQLAGDTPRFADLNIDLAPLSPLLAQGGKLSGRVSGAIGFQPVNVALQLDKAGIALAPEVAIDSVSGKVMYSGSSLQCENLRVLGADSDCTFGASLQNRVLDAKVTGAKLNCNAIEAMYRAAMPPAPKTGDHPAAASAAPAPHMTGKATVQLGALFYRRARLDDVRADIAFKPDAVAISNLNARQDKGAVQGNANLSYGAPNRLDFNLSLAGVDFNVLDALLFTEPRGLQGTTSGPVNLRFPLASGDTLYRGLNGTVDVKAKDGTYGKIRYATELLTVLKGTEIVRLKIPGIKDKGLTFKTSTIKLQIADGRINVERFTLDDPSYAMAGGGTIDLPGDKMDVTLGFNPLESVTGLMRVVPGVGNLLEGILAGGTGLRIRATGSPFNPKVWPEAGALPIKTEGPKATAPETPAAADPANPPKEKTTVNGFLKDLLKPFK